MHNSDLRRLNEQLSANQRPVFSITMGYWSINLRGTFAMLLFVVLEEILFVSVPAIFVLFIHIYTF